MIQNYLKTGMVVYDSMDKQHFRSECCQTNFCQFTDKNHFPSFQFYTERPISLDDIRIRIYDLNDNLIDTFDDADFNAVNTIYHGTSGYTYSHNNVDIISYPAGVDYETGYYLELCFCADGGEFVFAAAGTFGLYVYSVDGDGNFTFLDSDLQAGGGSAQDVWSDGKFVFVANYTHGIEVYSIDSDGILTHVDNNDQGGEAQGVWGDGTFIYLANGTRGIEVYSVDGAGTLTHIDNVNTLGNGKGVWGDKDIIYLADGTNGIISFQVSATGILSGGDTNDQGGTACDVWGDGIFVYLANDTRGIEVYSVDALGNFTHLDNDFIAGNGLGVWGDGRFIYLANGTRGIESYTVNAVGVLTHVDNDDQGGTAYDVWGDNNFVYLANGGVTKFESYSVNDAGTLNYIDVENPNGTVLGAFASVPECNDPDAIIECLYSEAFKIVDCEPEGVGDGEDLITNGWFDDWSGAANPNNVPDDWTLENNNATNYVADTGGECRMISDGTQTLQIYQTILTIGKWYVATINITNVTAGSLTFNDLVGVIVNWDTTGEKNVVFQAGGTNAVLRRNGVTTDIAFTDFRVEEFVGFEFCCDFMTLNWWSDCDWDRIIYQGGYRNNLTLADPEVIELEDPGEDINDNSNERLGEKFPKDIVIKKRYRFKIRIPEYLWNALIRLPAYGSEMPDFHCWITLPDGSRCPMSEVIVKGEWDTGNCFNTFEVEFVDGDEYPVVAGNCCKDEDISEI